MQIWLVSYAPRADTPTQGRRLTGAWGERWLEQQTIIDLEDCREFFGPLFADGALTAFHHGDMALGGL